MKLKSKGAQFRGPLMFDISALTSSSLFSEGKYLSSSTKYIAKVKNHLQILRGLRNERVPLRTLKFLSQLVLLTLLSTTNQMHFHFLKFLFMLNIEKPKSSIHLWKPSNIFRYAYIL